jgi:hypothetical protein
MGEQGPLQFDPEAMRAIGHRTVDALVDAIAAIEDQPVMCRVPAAPMRARLDAPPPAAGRLYEEVLAQVFSDVVPFCAHTGAGGYLAFIPGFPTWPSAMGDLIASALMMDASWWAGGAGGSQLELTVLRWFAEWLGYPATASGILVSGGSAANMTALACARERRVGAMRDDLVVYVSSQSHSSIARAARVLGFRPGQVRVLPLDDSFRLRVDVLEQAVAADRAAGSSRASAARSRCGCRCRRSAGTRSARSSTGRSTSPTRRRRVLKRALSSSCSRRSTSAWWPFAGGPPARPTNAVSTPSTWRW